MLIFFRKLNDVDTLENFTSRTRLDPSADQLFDFTLFHGFLAAEALFNGLFPVSMRKAEWPLLNDLLGVFFGDHLR